MIFGDKWTKRFISRRWGPGILTRVDQDVHEIHGESSNKKELDYVISDELNEEYKTEFFNWVSENNIQLKVVHDYKKEERGIVVERVRKYAVSLSDWKDWLKWKIGQTKTKKKPAGIPSEI